jgi:DHA3 family macrolide efflux protein-like MFS transporter
MTEHTSSENPISEKWAFPFFTIWIGQAVSLLGSQMVQFALIWWLTKTTGSAIVLTTATLVSLLPTVVLGPFVGALVDRWNRRKILLFSDSGIALATLILAYLFYMGWAKVWMVFLIAFLRGLGGGFHGPAMTASTSLMVPNKHLTRVQGINQSLNAGLNIISAPLGALLLEVLDVQGILMIDVGTALFAIIPLFFIAIPQPQNQLISQKENLVASVWEDFKAGLKYVMGWPGLRFLLLMALSINMIISPAFALLPLVVKEHFGGGALQLGWFNSAFGVGAVVGGLILSIWGGFNRKMFTTLLGLVGLAVGLMIMGFAPSSLMWFGIIGVLITGIFLPITNGPISAVLQATVEPSMQGRVFTLVSSLASAMTPLGLIIAGPLSELVNIQVWYVVGGIITLAFGLGGRFSKTFINIEDQPNAPA